MTDLILAIVHHVLVFGLVVTLAIEKALVRPAMTAADARKVAGVDAGYGITAGLVVVIGVCRVMFGAKGRTTTCTTRSSGPRWRASPWSGCCRSRRPCASSPGARA